LRPEKKAEINLELSTKISTFAAEKIFNYGLKRQTSIHRPHPGSIMKEWMVKTIYQHLKNNGFIK
jgi:hypothetical protein